MLFETDAQAVVHAIQLEQIDNTEFGKMVDSCCSILRRQPGFKIQFARREQNEAAHALARRSISFASPTSGGTPPL
ncbi:hypothetical protein LINPERHAP2_LOCUS14371 [Linum perenne]